MSETKALRLAPENITPLWDQIVPLLSDPLVRAGTHDEEDVRLALLGGRAHLWIQWSGVVDAAGVTEFVAYPKGLWLRIWLSGSKLGVKVDWVALDEIVSEFARANRCVGLEAIGRKGWLKRFPRLETVAAVMRLKL